MSENGGEVGALRRRVAELERRLDLALDRTGEPSSDNRTHGPMDRRSLLKVAGAAAAGAVGAMVVTATPASAGSDGDVILGHSNDAAGLNTYVTSTATAGTFSGANTAVGSSTAHGLTGSAIDGCGISAASSSNAGVHGESNSGPGVHGQSNSGNSVAALAPTTPNTDGTQLLLAAGGFFGAPFSGTHTLGQFWVDAAGSLFQCVVAGAGTNARWVNLTSGSKLIALASPVRVYDSRPNQNPTAVGPKTPLTSGTDRVVDATGNSSGVPPAATAVLLNLAVVNTVNTGFLGLFKDSIAYPGNANINWFGSGQILSNAVTTAVDNIAKFKIHCGGAGQTDVVVDVIGYYQ